jgi:hypothetical protein
MSLFGAGGRGRTRTSELAGAVMNLLLGVICLFCGLSGKLVFVGTSSSVPFTVVGGVLVAVGGFRLWRWIARSGSDGPAGTP